MTDIKPKNPIPISSVRVIGRTVRVIPWSFDDADQSQDGEWSDRDGTIKVGTHLDPDTFREVLLHEIIHAVESRLGMSLRENQVVALGVGLDLVFQENPELLRLYG